MGDHVDLVRGWQNAGIGPGDTVLVHSRLVPTLKRLRAAGLEATPDIVLDSLLDALGSHGTLLLPLFNFDFTRGVPFDIRSTPSQMGILTEAGRLRANAVRTGHPIYSFAAIGAKADAFRDVVNFSGYAQDSPFGILYGIQQNALSVRAGSVKKEQGMFLR